jgi:hypothetical protein
MQVHVLQVAATCKTGSTTAQHTRPYLNVVCIVFQSKASREAVVLYVVLRMCGFASSKVRVERGMRYYKVSMHVATGL